MTGKRGKRAGKRTQLRKLASLQGIPPADRNLFYLACVATGVNPREASQNKIEVKTKYDNSGNSTTTAQQGK